MSDFRTLVEVASALDAGTISSVELTRDVLSAIADAKSLNAFITVVDERALAQARVADDRRAKGLAAAVTGIPIAYKDIFCTRGVRTTCGSRMLANFVPPYDATVVERFDAAGAVMVGKTNMDEFAMGSSNETSYFGPVHNPHDPNRVPGGSSGGSAAAVAAGLVFAAMGTDTGGSIRQPAAFTGVSGLKPTYGRISRYGMVAFASSLDQGGPIARSVRDLEVLFGVAAGFDPRDSTSAELAVDPARHKPIDALRIGLPKEYFAALGDRRVAASLDTARRWFEEAGATVIDVSLPNTDVAIPTYYVVASAEASTNLSRYDGVRYGHRCEAPQDLEDLYLRSRSQGFGREVKRRILTGTYTLSIGYFDAYYLKAQRVRRLIRDEFVRTFADVDVLLTPTTPGVAFPIGAVSDPIEMYQQDVFTVGASLAGLPAMSIPCGWVDGLPVGMQLIGPHFGESLLFTAGDAFQRATDWHTRRPGRKP